jgi:hypothetical protein
VVTETSCKHADTLMDGVSTCTSYCSIRKRTSTHVRRMDLKLRLFICLSSITDIYEYLLRRCCEDRSELFNIFLFEIQSVNWI